MKKFLILSSVASMIDQFLKPNISLLMQEGHEVHVISNFSNPGNITIEKSAELKRELEQENVKVMDLGIQRNPINVKNVLAYIKLKKIIEKEHYDIIHLHSPVGSIIGRLAAKNSRSRIIYTVHGFHFYKGAPLKNWVIFYPVEKYLTKYTDVLITINREDYNLAKRKFKIDKINYIPGVGIDIDGIKKEKIINNIRSELSIKDTEKIILSVGELNDNKNHKVAIKALSQLKSENFVYLIVGKGPLKGELKAISDIYNVGDKVKFLGYRKDVISLMKQSDVFVFPSKREGLPVSVMEAMACDMITIVSDIRGNKDLITNSLLRFDVYEDGKLEELLENVFENYEKYKDISKKNSSYIYDYSIENINQKLLTLYRE